MAQPTNTFDQFDAVGAREDLADTITNVDPFDTPLYSALKKSKATNAYHEWQTDTLRAPGANKHIPGDDTVASAMTATTRLGNYTQILKEAVVIPDGDKSTNKAGRGSELTYQMLKLGKEIRMDLEYALFQNGARAAGSSTVAPAMAGLKAWIYSNDNFGATGASPTGDGTDTRTAGTNRALTQTIFDTTMQTMWEAGGKGSAVYLTADQMNVVLGFTGFNNQRTTVDAKSGGVYNNVELYSTPWGRVKFTMSHNDRQPTTDLYILQEDMWGLAVKRDWTTKRLASNGDSEKMQLLSECTLVSKNEKSSAAIFDLS